MFSEKLPGTMTFSSDLYSSPNIVWVVNQENRVKEIHIMHGGMRNP
jgi:hypothetical protein